MWLLQQHGRDEEVSIMSKELYDPMIYDFGPLITLIVVITISVIAVLKLGIKFDLNELFYTKKSRHLSLARLNCPHTRLAPEKGGMSYRSLFVCPPGTLNWVCTQCGTVTHMPLSEE